MANDGKRFIKGSGIAKHREWRGLKDTFYDYTQWVVNLGLLVQFVAKSPVRIMRGMLEYRWLGSYLGSLNMVDKCMAGMRGPALRVSHTQMHAIMKGATQMIADSMKGDRRFGDTKFADKFVMLEQTMCPEIIAGFPESQGSAARSASGAPRHIHGSESGTVLHGRHGKRWSACRLLPSQRERRRCCDQRRLPPIGACLVTNNMPCDSSTMNSQLIERRVTIPSMVAGIPMRWEDAATDKYALAQMKEVIRFIRAEYRREVRREGVLRIMKKHNAEVRNEFEAWEYIKTPYTPYANIISPLFHAFYFTFSGGRMPYIDKAAKKALKIAEKAYRDKVVSFPNARHRMITWGGPGCYYVDFNTWAYNCWGVLVVAQMDMFSGNVIMSEDNVDQALIDIAHNYERGVMRRHLTGGYKHLLEFWDEAEKFNCDMILVYDDITCKGAMGLAGVVNDQAKERGAHLVWVQNDMFDHRTISRSSMRKQFSDYMTAVMQEEPIDASLLDLDDYEGW
ncbi:MAG: 2-hydroxyacyl-CoA dehydratase family protein [Oscillospiraceae bacterium]